MKKIISMLLAVSMVFGTVALSAGYDVVVEPVYESAPIDIEEGSGLSFTAIFPTPFYEGVAVVHDGFVEPDYFTASKYATSSYVVDGHGNVLNLGDYDAYGVESAYAEFEGGYTFYSDGGVDRYGYIKVAKDKKLGLINTEGKVILECKYDDIRVTKPTVFYVTLGEERIFVDDKGEEIPDYTSRIEEYEDLPWPDQQTYEGKYFDIYTAPYDWYLDGISLVNGVAVVSEYEGDNAKVGVVDKNDNIIVPFEYDLISPIEGDGYAWALKDGKWGIIYVSTNEVAVTIDGTAVEFDQQPLVINGRTLVPLRAIFEKLDATVEWDDATKTVTSTKDGTTISLTIGSNQLTVNGEAKELDVPATIVNGRTLVPARAVSESFNLNVGWDAETNTVSITK